MIRPQMAASSGISWTRAHLAASYGRGRMAVRFLAFLCLFTADLHTAEVRFSQHHHESVRPGGDIIFPEDRQTQRQLLQEEDSIYIRMNEVHNASEFFRVFMPDVPLPTVDGLPGIFGRDKSAVEAALNSKIAKAATCQPEIQVMELPRATETVLWPPCIRVERCGGCCTSKLMDCIPIKQSTIKVQVIRARFPRSGKTLEFQKLEEMEVVKHDKCECQCREKASDCTSKEEYKANECRCVCKNQNEASSCTGPDKFWDVQQCACTCKNFQECSTGSFFNLQTCRCEASGLGDRRRRPSLYYSRKT